MNSLRNNLGLRPGLTRVYNEMIEEGICSVAMGRDFKKFECFASEFGGICSGGGCDGDLAIF